MKKFPLTVWLAASVALSSCDFKENKETITDNTDKKLIEIFETKTDSSNITDITDETDTEAENNKISYEAYTMLPDSINSPYKDMIQEYTQALILGNLTKTEIAITIDDWNWAKNIETILDTLKNHNIKATFFIVWTRIKMHAKQWRRAIDEWHQICNHTFDHHYFKKAEPAELERQILEREKAVKDSLWEDYLKTMKQDFPFFRFPWWFWAANPELISVLKKHGYVAIWRSTDRRQTGTTLKNWEIALFHFKPQDFERIWAFAQQAEKEWKSCKQMTDLTNPESWYTPIWWNNRHQKEVEAKKALNEKNQTEKDTIQLENH